jgi:hypothetical protein
LRNRRGVKRTLTEVIKTLRKQIKELEKERIGNELIDEKIIEKRKLIERTMQLKQNLEKQ